MYLFHQFTFNLSRVILPPVPNECTCYIRLPSTFSVVLTTYSERRYLLHQITFNFLCCSYHLFRTNVPFTSDYLQLSLLFLPPVPNESTFYIRLPSTFSVVLTTCSERRYTFYIRLPSTFSVLLTTCSELLNLFHQFTFNLSRVILHLFRTKVPFSSVYFSHQRIDHIFVLST